jgi:hypothetical protein
MTQQPPGPGLPVCALKAYAVWLLDELVTAGVTGTAVHVDVYGTHDAGAGLMQTGEPVRLHDVMQLVVVAFLQWRFAFLTQRWALARGALGHDAVAASTHADIASPQTVWHRRQALGVTAQDAPAAR